MWPGPCENREVVVAVRATRSAGLGRLVLPALAIAYGIVSAAVALDREVPTTYAAMSSGAAAVDLAAGLGLIVAGLVLWWERPVGSLGPVTTLLGVAWLAPDWVGWEGGPALARSLAMVAAPFLLPLLVHLVLAFPAGRIAGPAARFAVGLVYGVTAVVSVGRALFRDPFLDLHCWSNCTDNVFLVHSDPGLVDVLDGFWLRFSLAAWLVLAAIACWRLLSATRPARAAVGAVLVPAAVAAAAEVAYAIALLRDPAEDPQGEVFRAVFFARALSFACLAAGIAWTVVRNQRTRAALARLAADLGEAPQPGSLEAALARSLGDEGLEVAYPVPGSPAYVDAEGRPVETPVRDRRRATTPIVRNGEPVAVVIHHRSLSGARELEGEIGAAARLAVDNERLRAGLLAQLEDLRASRARIVETGDLARQRIERDLHDGAQQRLLTLFYELRLARAAADAEGDAELATKLDSSCTEVQAALAELRDLAHGIYPVILTEAGLGPALETLADEAPLAVEVEEIPGERFPEAVERAAYVVVSDAIEAAARKGADRLAVELRRDGARLLVRAGPLQSAPSVHLADRVGALGGRVEREDGALRAEIPCA
jgi:signal transduction histidine kinase